MCIVIYFRLVSLPLYVRVCACVCLCEFVGYLTCFVVL